MDENASKLGYDNLRLAGELNRWRGNIGLAGAVGLVYFLLACFVILGLRAAGLAMIWLPAGFATGVLIVLGPRARLPVAAGVVIAVVLVECVVRDDRSLWIALADSLCDASEPLIIAELIRRYFGEPFTLDQVRNVVGMFAAILVGVILSAIGAGIGSVLILGPEPPFLSIWWFWLTSGVVGEVAIVPFIIGLAAIRGPPPWSELTPGGVALVAVAAMTAIIILLPQQFWATMLPGVLLFPL
jgi:integral membrane sensor domain MASE1